MASSRFESSSAPAPVSHGAQVVPAIPMDTNAIEADTNATTVPATRSHRDRTGVLAVIDGTQPTVRTGCQFACERARDTCITIARDRPPRIRTYRNNQPGRNRRGPYVITGDSEVHHSTESLPPQTVPKNDVLREFLSATLRYRTASLPLKQFSHYSLPLSCN